MSLKPTRRPRDGAETRARTKEYGKLFEEFLIHGDGWALSAELRYGEDRFGQYVFTAWCEVQPSRHTDTCSYGADVSIFRDKDANVARKKLVDDVRSKVQVKWEPFIQIRVGGDSRGLGGGLTVRHQVVLIGTRMNGEKCHKGHALRATRDDPRRGQKAGDWYSNHATLDGLPECDDGFDRDYSEPRYGLIPYSDETLERLEQIQERLTELRKQVEAMITGPDSAAIVQAIMTTNLLPAPKEKA